MRYMKRDRWDRWKLKDLQVKFEKRENVNKTIFF